MADLNTDIRYIKGVGEARAKAFEKLGVFTLGDLIAYYPRRWEDRSQLYPIRDLPEGEYACCKAMIAQPPTAARIRGGQTLVLDVSFFHQEYRKNVLHPGETYIFYGKVEGGGVRRRMVNPLLETEGKQLLTGRIMPIYPLTAGLTQTMVAKAVRQGLDQCRDLPEDVLPDGIRQAHHLCYAGFAYENIHFPASEEALNTARRRLVFEELFLLSCGLSLLRQRRETVAGLPCQAADMAPFYAALPFALTAAQRRAIADAVGDMTSGRPMNRLCQGDVGSGKTMVAAACVWFAAQSGWQSALMAPTEILARQHYENLAPLFARFGLPCALLTGSTPARERRAILAGLQSGDITLCIGTHALLTADVQYARLGLVITDEQHRFGVEQRSALSHKSAAPHTLVLSATPIPRTLALIIYGDLDVSVIDELPPGRQPIRTVHYTDAARLRLFGFMRQEIKKGRQIYVVYPLIKESETMDYKDLQDGYEAISRDFPLPEYVTTICHGKMKPEDKEDSMRQFKSGEANIMVATSVIEVGVDVPNATVMVIESAERFGLSQLHQLRGRVGRGSQQSYCILMSGEKLSKEARLRLEAMCETNDGFRLAELDLKLRGAGDVNGTLQSGMAFDLKIANPTLDSQILTVTREAAAEVLTADPTLTQNGHEGLRELRKRYSGREEIDFSQIS